MLSEKIGPAPKHDFYHRLYFAIKWLNDGAYHRSREADFGWSKTSLQRDLEHCLRAIIEGPDDHIRWPDENCRQELATIYPGIFRAVLVLVSLRSFKF
jgi:hypothetical protein